MKRKVTTALERLVTISEEPCQGGPRHAKVQRDDKHVVQHGVGDPGGHGESKAQIGPAGGDEEALEQELEDAGGGKEEHDAQIVHAVGQQQVAGPQQAGERGGEEKTQQGKEETDPYPDQCEEGKVPAGGLLLPLAHLSGGDGASTGGQHNAKANGHADKGEDDVYRREGVGANKAGDEDPVHDGVEGHEDHHNDGGQGKPEEGPETELPVQGVIQSKDLLVKTCRMGYDKP